MAEAHLLYRMQALATTRGRGLRIRLGLGAVVFAIGAWLVHPLVLVAWAILMPASQLIDHHIYRRFRDLQDERPVRRSEVRACAISTAMAATIFSTLPAAAYFAPEPEAKLFALLWLCGALLNAMIQQGAVRAIFLAGIIPLGAPLVLLPLWSLIFLPGNMVTNIAAFVMAAMFLFHTIMGVRIYRRSGVELAAARDAAVERGRAAEKANRAKSRFLALMSHELRTPLNGVLGASHLLRQTALSDRQKELVDALGDAGEVLMVILNDILDLAKLDAARLTLDPSPVHLESMAMSLCNLWSSRAEEKSLALSVRCEIDPGAEWASVDKIRLRQIVGNLLSNAIKFTDSGSVELVLRARKQEDAVGLRFEVRDTGHGIAPETMARLFQAFSQADDSFSRKNGGTGLGLLICRRLAELMGGTVEAESIQGEGSVFSVAFDAPVAEPVEAEAPAPGAAADAGRPLSILIAEDNAINRLVVAGLLEPGGHSLSFAENGVEAVEAANAQGFDLIFMDLHMPEMDGLFATQMIRGSQGPNADCFICALSADAGAEQVSEALGRGMNAYLTKPIAPAELDKIVARGRQHADHKARPACMSAA